MKKLTSINSVNKLQERIAVSHDAKIPTIIINAGTCGQASGANDLIRIAKKELLASNSPIKPRLRITGCHGFCELEPSVLIEPGNIFYPKIDTENMARIVEAVSNNKVLEDLLYTDPKTGKKIKKQDDIPFFKKQVRTILSRNEKVDPIRIYNYIEYGGYLSLAKVLKKGKPKYVIEQVKTSELRGRGGAGFSTGLKWEMLANHKSYRGKYLVCNADGGDPGAYMDRSLLEGNPHSIIEGMIIGAYGTGATNGVIYVRSEYPLAIKHLIIALRQAHELGLLGENILGTDFSFDIELARGAGAFVCGEETALMRSIEGKMGEPRQRPPYPVQKGIYGKPTAINNVETWANISIIIENGASNFAKIGTKNNSGTKLFSLVGKIKNTGLIEVPMGMTIREIINDIGGGSASNKKIKAVQTGGPSGGCIPASLFGLPIDYDSLSEAGTIMGSGGMIVMDEDNCMVDVAKYFMNFLKDESCGKCYTCRKGTQRLYEILDDISKGNGTLTQLDLLEELGDVVKDTSMCGLGQSAANPVLSTLKYFRDEYQEHIISHECSSGVCTDLVGAPCQSTCPIGTEAWRYIAHIGRGENEDAYLTIRETNPFPSICARVCHHPCEDRCKAGLLGGQSISIRALKRYITDRTDPAIYKAEDLIPAGKNSPHIAVVGSGPAGLTAAHYLSLKGFKVTVFESEDRLGGMMLSAIPAYRLPRETVAKEIKSLLNKNITIKCNSTLGKDFTIESLFKDGFKATFLALGAHKSRRLSIPNEGVEGVYPSIQFLKAYNLKEQQLAKGRVGIIGGGNSAIDAARVSIRQRNVDSVTLYYRRTEEEMPAYAEEIEAAIQEGVKIIPLVTPVKILADSAHITGIEFLKNKLGELDNSGRRRPIPVEGTEFTVPLDTLIVGISEGSDVDCVSVASSMRIETTKWETVKVDFDTLCTNQQGVFAGGDVVRGPNTLVEAIADGKRVAIMIERYLNGEDLTQPIERKNPEIYVEPAECDEEKMMTAKRVETPRAVVEWRKRGFAEVEMSLTTEEARTEACRCLRCDLEFTKPKENTEKTIEIETEETA